MIETCILEVETTIANFSLLYFESYIIFLLSIISSDITSYL